MAYAYAFQSNSASVLRKNVCAAVETKPRAKTNSRRLIVAMPTGQEEGKGEGEKKDEENF